MLLLMRAEADPLHEDAAVMKRLSTATTKCAVWLMDHLTAAHGSPARKAVVGQRLVLQQVVDLISCKEGEETGMLHIPLSSNSTREMLA